MGGTVEGWAEFDRLEQEAKVRDAEKVRERFITFSSDSYGHAAAYDNAVIIAGYAAFFALWSGVATDITPLARLVTVVLMCASLMLYISWHMIQMLTRQRYDRARAATFAHRDDPKTFDALWQQVEQERGIALQRTLRFWPFIFLPSLAFGFASAVTLTYNALAVILGWPQLRG
jgi:hypothetical protein